MRLRQRDVLAVVNDLRLTPAAVRVVLDVALRGEGTHEIAHTHFVALLNHSGDKRLRQALREAQEFGWITRTPGGRGHHDLYTFSPAKTDTLNGVNGGSLSPAEKTHLNDSLSPAEKDTLNADSPAKKTHLNARYEGMAQYPDFALRSAAGDSLNFRVSPRANLSDPRARDPYIPLLEDDDDVGDSIKNRSAKVVSTEVEEILFDNESLFQGCRGALRDYLKARVPIDRQVGYVQTLVMWLNDARPVFRWPDGSKVDPTDRPRWLAASLNDLAGSDEETGHARPVGDPANLRNKLRHLLETDWNERNPAAALATPAPASRARTGARGFERVDRAAPRDMAPGGYRPTGIPKEQTRTQPGEVADDAADQG